MWHRHRRRLYTTEQSLKAGTVARIDHHLFMRAGYLKNAVSSGNSLADSGGFKAGFGLKLKNFNIDYAVTPFGDIGKAHRLSLGAGFYRPFTK